MIDRAAVQRWGTRCLATLARLVAFAFAIGGLAHAENWKIGPSISLNETLTDNVALAAAGQRQGDLVTDLSPGIAIDGAGARTKVHFDYKLHNLVYERDAARNSTQNSLNAFGTLEAIENWLFIDAHGSISQKSISAFGTVAPSNANIDANRTETSAYQVSPYVRGKLGASTDYQLRYNWTTARSGSRQLPGTDTAEWVGTVKGDDAHAHLGWSIDGSRQQIKRSNGGNNEADRLRGVLSYQVDPQFRASLIGGREANDYLSLQKEGHNTSGVGLDWSPTETTKLSASRERRFFGNGHTFTFTHRTPLSAWKFSDSRDVSVLPNQLATVGLGSIFDLLFDSSLFATNFPDPLDRAQQVNRFLQSQGIPADAQVSAGFLTSRVLVDRRREASVALIGANNTVTFSASQSDRRALGAAAAFQDDFNQSTAIRQRGFGANWAHKLSALSSLTLLASWLRSEALASGGSDSTQSKLSLLFSTQIGPRTFFTLGARHVRFDASAATNYRENAITASVSMRF